MRHITALIVVVAASLALVASASAVSVTAPKPNTTPAAATLDKCLESMASSSWFNRFTVAGRILKMNPVQLCSVRNSNYGTATNEAKGDCIVWFSHPNSRRRIINAAGELGAANPVFLCLQLAGAGWSPN